MSCLEKRHMSHRGGSMLHHRFPNGFSDLFMDDTDREVSTLTDRAFRSLCIGDDAVYNDEFLYGYSPFSCHKPLVGEPVKKTHHKESKKQGQSKSEKNYNQPWKQQQKGMSNMSSFLKAFSATEESCEGMLIKNGCLTDLKGESWDKSALRSIQRELSEFSSDYPTNLTDGHYKKCHRHHSGSGPSNKTGKEFAPPSGKSTKIKNGKSTVKLRKLNIKNFFLHSEFSPFQAWRDFNRFPFGQEDTVLPTDCIPKWYDLPFYKELTEAHRQETQHTEEVPPKSQKALQPPPSIAPKPTHPPPPPKVLPKPSAAQAEKRCSSDVGEGSSAPWRRNNSRAKSVIPLNQSGIPAQESISKTADESMFLVKKETRSVEVKAVEEVSSLASTPFSICQLMTPLIPSRQPTETSEILQAVLSPSALDLPLRPHSEAKLTPEPPVKRESYKSLASSILFNLKDNRKRVKSRYSPPKFKTLEVPEGGSQSPQSDNLKCSQAGSEGNASGLSTPAIIKEEATVCSPVLESNSIPTIDPNKPDSETPLSDDYLLSHLLQSKKEAAAHSSLSEDNPISPLIHSKKTKSPRAKKLNYPSLNLYKKASLADSDMKYLQVPPNSDASTHTDQPNELSPPACNKDPSPKAWPANTFGLSPNTLNVNKDCSPLISPCVPEKEGLSSNVSVCKILSNVPCKAKQPTKDLKDTELGLQPVISKERDSNLQHLNTMEVIRAAREAISAAKNKARMAAQSDNINKTILQKEELKEREIDKRVDISKKMCNGKSLLSENDNTSSQSRNEAMVCQKANIKKEAPPVPKRNFTKSDIQLSLDKQQTNNVDNLTNGDSGNTNVELEMKEHESAQKQARLKHIFSARQNNYIKYQRHAEMDEEQEELEDGDLKVKLRLEADEEVIPLEEMRDSEHIINDLHALKELERARLSDRIHDNSKNKLDVTNIEEEARAKNDLISRELRNIKKGMLSMRGNTSAKRELFTKKEVEQSRPEAFTKIDSNVIVNKALINDNYDKAKVALEEIISERQKRNNVTEQDANPVLNESADDESYVKKVQQGKKAMKDVAMEAAEKQTGFSNSPKTDLKERLSDLRDNSHIRQILSQTEPRSAETYKTALKKSPLKNSAHHVGTSYESEEGHLRDLDRRLSEDGIENMMNQNGGRSDAPPVPPRNKKGENRGDGSLTEETNNQTDLGEKDIFKAEGKYENDVVHLKEMSLGSGKQNIASDPFMTEAVPCQSETYSDQKPSHVLQNASSHLIIDAVCDTAIPAKNQQTGYTLGLSGNEEKERDLLTDWSSTKESTAESSSDRTKELYKIKRKAPLKPDNVNVSGNVSGIHLMEGEIDKTQRTEEFNAESEVLNETPGKIISPLLLVNGMSINQSPPDHASLSSKSSYFSVESALHRNFETESNVYHSLENLIGEVEEVDELMLNILQNKKQDSDKIEAEYYSLSDHDSELERVKQPIMSPEEEAQVPNKFSKEGDDTSTDHCSAQDEQNQTPMSPSNTFSPTLGIPALFKVKDNTFSNKVKKSVQPWPRRGSQSVSVKVEEELHPVKENPKLLLTDEPANKEIMPGQDETFKAKIITTSPHPLLLPSNLQTENPKKPQDAGFLTVPQEDDRFSGVSPSSEGVESITTSTIDTADEMGVNDELLVEHEVLKVPSERSGSTCSGNESQTGLPKPPAVLPKSEKAVLRAMKLATRRMKKEEAQKSSHKSSSSKHRPERHKSDKSEHKNSRNSKSSERKHRDKTYVGHNQSETHNSIDSNDGGEQPSDVRRGYSSENQQLDKKDMIQETQGQSQDMIEALPRAATQRQGRSNSRHIREKPQQRHYSSDRVISNVPVYKAHVGDRPTPVRPFQRSQSSDRYIGDKLERRLSADTTIHERPDLRTQRIEKSIMDELQQRGRARDKTGRDNPLRRSHSIDAYSADVPHPSTLSRQSSHTSHSSQLSRQSSIEHAIVTQSFPMTQRKLLQDPDSGQYFFVDMPVQVKTKTFFDPETGSYVQLPVQPPEAAVPQPSPLEVLTPPLVVYHGFVPVPLSPMAQKASIQAHHMAAEEFDQRHLERSRQMHCTDRHQYLEPVYGQHEHMLGEFIGTEELDCPS
ncbi:uncharacterized protein LOC122867690 [Xyrichtys novacula]|uniref:Uncharacterized protein LOC122867690 n=1 Tax=Xyrichtys novacula TaxID=13765 RepID=A0AAV1H8W0_XYRNO|nr:uncharacterized protein LOC122867690 [Xyrichtys novacula]